MAFGITTTVLASAVADSGTFTVLYPSGLTQANFLYGLSQPSGNIMSVNAVNRYTQADSKFSVSYGSSDITVTNSTGETLPAGATVKLQLQYRDNQPGNVVTLAFPINLASITTAQDVVTDAPIGLAGTIEHVYFVTNVPASTASKLATLNLEINSTNVTGGAVALTTVGVNTMGKVVAGSAITANNVLTPDDVLSVEASSVTAFAEGSGTLYVRIRA